SPSTRTSTARDSTGLSMRYQRSSWSGSSFWWWSSHSEPLLGLPENFDPTGRPGTCRAENHPQRVAALAHGTVFSYLVFISPNAGRCIRVPVQGLDTGRCIGL